MAQPKPETVNHPAHYNSHPSGVECIDVVEHMTFNAGNAVKYIWRAGLKDGEGDPREKRIEDLKKSVWYIQREIDLLTCGPTRHVRARKAPR